MSDSFYEHTLYLTASEKMEYLADEEHAHAMEELEEFKTKMKTLMKLDSENVNHMVFKKQSEDRCFTNVSTPVFALVRDYQEYFDDADYYIDELMIDNLHCFQYVDILHENNNDRRTVRL